MVGLSITNIESMRQVGEKRKVSLASGFAGQNIEVTKANNIDAIDQNPIFSTAYDADGQKAQDIYQQTVESKTYNVYRWGRNNLLPNECVAIIRSNGDAVNLLATRADFLYGSGVDFYREIIEGENVRYELFRNDKIKKYRKKLKLDKLVLQMIQSLVETWCIVVNKKFDGEVPILSWVDPLTFRFAKAPTQLALLSPDWNDVSETSSKGKVVKLVDSDSNQPGIIFKKIPQVGQPYYPRPPYWSEESIDFVQTMNYCSAKIRQNTKSNNNIAHIFRISQDYIDQLANNMDASVANLDEDTSNEDTSDIDFGTEDADSRREKARNDLYEMLNTFMFSGTRTIIFDECTVDPATGKMIPNIEMVEVKRTLNTKEFAESYELSLRGFANSIGLQIVLVGLSDGGKLGGSGSEVKVSANYQQTFRTNRERLLVTELLDDTYREFLELPDDVVIRFKNVVLVNDNADKTGVSSSMKTESNPK